MIVINPPSTSLFFNIFFFASRHGLHANINFSYYKSVMKNRQYFVIILHLYFVF